jgi:hypothetical protein
MAHCITLWWVLMKTELELRVPQEAENRMASLATLSCSGRFCSLEPVSPSVRTSALIHQSVMCH